VFWPNLILYATLGACVLITVWMVRRYDLYDHEPWWYLLLAAGLGAAGMYASGLVQRYFIHAAIEGRGEATDTYQAFLAGTIEEGFKLIAVAAAVVLGRFVGRRFDEPLDGIVLGSFAGLGAAVEESVYYLGGWSADRPDAFLPPQEPIRLAGHLVMGGITCFGLGMLTLPRRGRWSRWHAAWAVPAFALIGAGLHMGWDVVAFDAAAVFHARETLEWWHTWTPVAIMLGGLVLYRGLVAWAAWLTRYSLQMCDVRTRECPPTWDG
jgi:RsiW-degrading membrane proteinase PrsW (M82 family)